MSRADNLTIFIGRLYECMYVYVYTHTHTHTEVKTPLLFQPMHTRHISLLCRRAVHSVNRTPAQQADMPP